MEDSTAWISKLRACSMRRTCLSSRHEERAAGPAAEADAGAHSGWLSITETINYPLATSRTASAGRRNGSKPNQIVKGLIVGEELRCPLHHACFSLKTGEALRAPAFDSIPCWRVERIGDTVFVREKLPPKIPEPLNSSSQQERPASVVIVGAGAAGLAAAEMLRRKGYDGPVIMISADDSAPYDRPNLSKEFLAGTAPEEWMPLRPPDFYTTHRIDLILHSRVSSIDVKRKRVQLENGNSYFFGALLLATGADPIKLPVAGASDSPLHYLRTFTDCRALVNKAVSAKRVVIVGASFIALEVAASLRERDIGIHIVAPEQVPLERIFGREIGKFVQHLHLSHGVAFHLGESVARIDGRQATLTGGSTLDADFFVLGVGVRPSLALAEEAGLKLDDGILVDEYLQTSEPRVGCSAYVLKNSLMSA